MALRLRDVLVQTFGQLRYEPAARRVRAILAGDTVVDTERALLIWEPQRVIPYYAVPVEDVRAELFPASTAADESPQLVTLAPDGESTAGVTIVRPGSFAGHTVHGDALTARIGDTSLPGAAFRFTGEASTGTELTGYVGLDFAAFDTWLEEDETVIAHPRDPFHRVDVRRSSRKVRIELGGQLLAESSRPRLLFETHLPTRFYLPPEDVDIAALRPSTTATTCAYKGAAHYWGAPGDAGDGVDIAWSYPEPLPEAVEITGMIAFFDERVDVTLDGQHRERPRTPWSRPS
jgi:uncharacterized protein (DUF427 family)